MCKKVFKPEYFEDAKQVKFLDLGETNGEETWCGGIAINDKIICGCCGTLFDIPTLFEDWEDYGKELFPDIETPLIVYDYWVNISESIIGE